MNLEEKLQNVATPSYVMDEKKLRENLEVLKMVQDKTGCHILLAQKAFSMFYFYPMMGKYLALQQVVFLRQNLHMNL